MIGKYIKWEDRKGKETRRDETRGEEGNEGDEGEESKRNRRGETKIRVENERLEVSNGNKKKMR